MHDNQALVQDRHARPKAKLRHNRHGNSPPGRRSWPASVAQSTLALLAAMISTGCTAELRWSQRQEGQSITDGGRSADAPTTRDSGSGGGTITIPTASCATASGGGTHEVATPVAWRNFSDSYHEGWVASPAVADLDGDGNNEIVAARDTRLIVWRLDGSVRFSKDFTDDATEGRAWASPVVADLVPERPGLEIVVASRSALHAYDKDGNELTGFPHIFRDEMRSLSAGDIDGDGRLEIVVMSTNHLGGGQVVLALQDNGQPVAGFPVDTRDAAQGCQNACWVVGGFNQNLGIADLDGDGRADIVATQDNAYIGVYQGDGHIFDSATIFADRPKWPGIRFLHDYALAKQGYPDRGDQLQAHFTSSAPALADLDGDGRNEIAVLGSVQDADQTYREQGVALWLLEQDGSRVAGWEAPYHVSQYLAGLWDYEGTNVVGETNQVQVADINGDKPGPELIFAAFDGQIHCLSAKREPLWSYRYTDDDRSLTTGVAIADLSGDGSAEAVFASYSPDNDRSFLFVLDAAGKLLHKLSLPGRGSMSVPTIADVDGDGTLEILVDLKDQGGDGHPQLLGYTVPGSSNNCLLWPTGRANLLRNGYVKLQTP